MNQGQGDHKPIERFIASHGQKVFGVAIIAALFLAWQFRFVQDDAFISFTYAKSLVEGHGLTWFGDRVEGYTNFLWVLWIALGLKIGVEPIVWSYVGGLLSFAGCIWSIWEIARRMFRSYLPTLLSVAFFIGNFSVISYATGGLETMLQTFLLSLSVLFAYRITTEEPLSPTLGAALSLSAAGAIMTRLDSAVIVTVIGLAVAYRFWKHKPSPKILVAIIVPAATILLVWFAWRLQYYGRLLPNTYYAKVGWDERSFENGFLYLGRFLHWYLLWPFVILGVVGMARSRKRIDASFGLLLLIVLAWSAYIVVVGGDFMEFRFIVPMAPFFFILLSYLIWKYVAGVLVKNTAIVALLSLLILTAASIEHGRSFTELTDDKTLDSIHMLSIFYGAYPDQDWERFGGRMKEELAGTNAIISTSAVGSIPFYSGLRTVDAIGLCDRNVTDSTAYATATFFRPGHTRRVRMSYLKRRGVNFVLDQPTPVVRGLLNAPWATGGLDTWALRAAHRDEPPDSVETVVSMPLDGRTSLLMLYVTKTAVLDSVIRTHGWERTEVRMR